ncbi:MAG TPA: hypothetical protein PKZ76_16225 [Xanthomonadaceae bacterium]|nr:hypothetical protein [Xanthomonadaceae bacterium]
MSITQLSQSLMPFLQDYLFDGVRARLAPGRILPHARSASCVCRRRRVVAAPVWRARARANRGCDRASA